MVFRLGERFQLFWRELHTLVGKTTTIGGWLPSLAPPYLEVLDAVVEAGWQHPGLPGAARLRHNLNDLLQGTAHPLEHGVFVDPRRLAIWVPQAGLSQGVRVRRKETVSLRWHVLSSLTPHQRLTLSLAPSLAILLSLHHSFCLHFLPIIPSLHHSLSFILSASFSLHHSLCIILSLHHSFSPSFSPSIILSLYHSLSPSFSPSIILSLHNSLSIILSLLHSLSPSFSRSIILSLHYSLSPSFSFYILSISKPHHPISLFVSVAISLPHGVHVRYYSVVRCC